MTQAVVSELNEVDPEMDVPCESVRNEVRCDNAACWRIVLGCAAEQTHIILTCDPCRKDWDHSYRLRCIAHGDGIPLKIVRIERL